MSDRIEVLVGGATGQQGGAVSRTLLQRGHGVKALTRRPESAAAVLLRESGAEIVQGSFDDGDALEHAMRGVDAVFTMSTSFEAGPEAEIRQGTAVADAALSAGVAHLVFSSVGSADRKTGIPHFETKYRVEQHIRSIGIPYTVIRPVYFYENIFNPFVLPAFNQGSPRDRDAGEPNAQQIGVHDIASFVVLALENRSIFLGESIDIAADELTGEHAARVVSEASGRAIEYVQTPLDQVRAMSEDFALNVEWMNSVGYSADIPYLKREFPDVEWETFEAWAARQDWTALNRSAPA